MSVKGYIMSEFEKNVFGKRSHKKETTVKMLPFQKKLYNYIYKN